MQTKQEWKIGDCLEVMRDMPADSIDIIIADPPYYKIKDDEWDNQWKTFQDYLDWLEIRAIEMKRVLKNNGSLYMFGDDQRIAYIQVMMDKHFTFLNHLVWYKRNNQAIKGAANSRCFASVSERILFYGLQDSTGLSKIHDDKKCFRPIKDYMNKECEKLRQKKGFVTKQELNEYLNELTNTASVVSRHYFCDSQWVFPTEKIYKMLQTTGYFPIPYDSLKNGFDDEMIGYEKLREGYESMRRPFNYTKGMYEVFDIPIINSKENTDHSTTKPIEVITRLIKTSMKDGATVLDPFCGSGTVLEACMNLDLECIGIDISDEWVPHYRKRLRLDNSKLTDTWDCGAVIKDA